MLTKFIPRFSLKKVLIRGMFVEQNIADAVGVTLCRPARRDGVMNNQPAVGSQKFYFHIENTEFTEAHLLRVLALRAVYVRPSWGGGPT
jgi:hypothetical protein